MDKVCVLMSTYNGEKYLEEQIDSILNQKDIDFNLIIRDDGSSDNTLNIIRKYVDSGKVKYYMGENLKPAHSFMNLLYNSPEADYYAFSDQDDFWMQDKLIKAIEKIKKSDKNEVVYFSNVEIVNEKLEYISIGNKKVKKTLASSFIQSPAIGCTMVINKKMKEKIISKEIKALEIGLHDSWIYRVGMSTGAEIIYDENAYIKYRQHENNVIGAKKSKTIKDKTSELLKVRKKNKSLVAKNLLNLYGNEMDENSKKILEKLSKFNEKTSFLSKLNLIFDKRFRSLNFRTNLKFYYDILKNRV